MSPANSAIVLATPASRPPSEVERGGFVTAASDYAIDALQRGTLFLDQRCALALDVAPQRLMHLSLAAFKTLVRDTFVRLPLEPECAAPAIGAIVPDRAAHTELMRQVREIVRVDGSLTPNDFHRLARLAQALEAPMTSRLERVS